MLLHWIVHIGLNLGLSQSALVKPQIIDAARKRIIVITRAPDVDCGIGTASQENDTQSLSSKVFAFMGSFSLYDGCGANYLKAHTTIPDIHVALDPAAEQPPNHFDLEPGSLGYATGMFSYFKQKLGSKVQTFLRGKGRKGGLTSPAA